MAHHKLDDTMMTTGDHILLSIRLVAFKPLPPAHCLQRHTALINAESNALLVSIYKVKTDLWQSRTPETISVKRIAACYMDKPVLIQTCQEAITCIFQDMTSAFHTLVL